MTVTAMTVQPGEADWRFDRWCKAHFPDLPFGAMQRLLRTGQFRLDGKRVEAGDRLVAGQTVRIPPMPAPEPGTPVRPGPAIRRGTAPDDARFIRELVVYEDARIVALNKPAGLAVQGGTGTSRHVDGMLQALAGPSGERPKLVHRLDKDTSGLLVVARDAAAARELGFAIQQHRVRKLYWAILVRGPERNEGRVDLPLAKAGPAGREKVEVDPEEGGQFAQTAFKVLVRAGRVAAWTAMVPLTGRTHQLRAHSLAIEAPILGDGKYGGRAAHLEGAPEGLMLLARSLELPGERGRPLILEADPPKAFTAALAWLGIPEPELPGASFADWPPEATKAELEAERDAVKPRPVVRRGAKRLARGGAGASGRDR